MRSIINNNELNSISTVVCYNDSSEKAVSVMYRNSNSKLMNSDFVEYGFSSFIEKYKYNDKDRLSLCDDYLVGLIDKNMEDLEKINTYLFPTISPDTTKNIEYGYFGSLTIQNRTLYFFNVNENISRIELYENPIITNNSDYDYFINSDKIISSSSAKPSIILLLGAENSGITDLDNSSLEYSKLQDEIYSKKTIWITTSSEDSQTINISYKLWISDNNSLRNKYKYSLRNDEYYSTINNIKLVGKKDDTSLYYERSSNTLVGSGEKVKNHPILDKKLNAINNTEFSFKVTYNVGDTVYYNGAKYISLCSNNRGNCPVLSSSWILDEKFNNYFTSRVIIYNEPLNSAVINPSNSISINTGKDVSNSASFILTPVLGYEFSTIKCDDTNFINFQRTSSSSKDIITISDKDSWDIIKQYKKLIFVMKQIQSNFKIRLKSDKYYDLLDWSNYLGEESFTFGKSTLSISIDSVKLNDSDITYQDNNIKLYVSKDSVIRFTLGKLTKFKINSINSITSSGSKNLEICQDNEGNYYFEDKMSSINNSYVINISSISYGIELIGDLKYYEVENKFIESVYKTMFNVRFYSGENNYFDQDFNKVVILAETNGFKTDADNSVEISYSNILKDPNLDLLNSSSMIEGYSVELNGVYFTLFYNSSDEIYTLHSSNTLEGYKIEILSETDNITRRSIADWSNYLMNDYNYDSTYLKVDNKLPETTGLTYSNGWWYNTSETDNRTLSYENSEIYNVKLPEGVYLFRLRCELKSENNSIESDKFNGAAICGKQTSDSSSILYNFPVDSLSSYEKSWETTKLNISDKTLLSFMVISNPRYKFKWEYKKLN